ncbi:MAG TPA: TetR family transcriptional regulator C-terminal domain-containing protein [Nitrospiria bacterium]|nr:TetR family transcriptional regulator C-terminal domain-containing protein [Nitrospiria bacterium]
MSYPEAISKREQIIQAAAQLVHLKGFHRTSVDDILVAAEAGKGQFYHYFKSKDEVGLAIVDRAAAQIHSRMLERLAQRPGLEAIEWMLDCLIGSAKQTQCEGGCPLGNLAAEMSDYHEEFRLKLARIFEAWRVMVERTLTAAQRRGEIPSDVEVVEVAFLVLSTIEGGMLLAKVEHDVRVMERTFEGLKRCLRHLGRTASDG